MMMMMGQDKKRQGGWRQNIGKFDTTLTNIKSTALQNTFFFCKMKIDIQDTRAKFFLFFFYDYKYSR